MEAAFISSDFTSSTWIADSGASTHIGNVDDGMIDVEDINEPIKVGNGNQVRTIKKGTLPLMLLQRSGDTMDILLEDYKYAPDFDVCLFSLMKAIEKGWTLSNKGTQIVLQKKNTIITFDRITKTKDGILCGVELLPRLGEHANPAADKARHDHPDNSNPKDLTPESESGGEGSTQARDNSDPEDQGSDSKSNSKKKPVYWNINRFHKVFGHASEEALKATAKHYGWKLTGTFEACEDCQMSNAQQKNVPKSTTTKSSTPGERLFVDMSSVSKHASLGGAKVWLVAVDDATGYTWSHLIKKKSHAPKNLKTLVRRLHDRKNPVTYIRMDDAGELKKFADECKNSSEECLRKIKFEHTSRDSPQFNGKVERKIAVITRRIKAALNAAKLTEDYRKVLWGEAVVNLTDIENVLLSKSYSAPAYIAFFERELEGMKNFRQFGEVAYVKFGDKMKGKLVNRGVPMIYLGRSRDHGADTYRFLNLATDKVINSRDATWLNKVYGEWKGLSLPTVPDTVTLLPVEAIETIKASEKKGIAEDQEEPEPEPEQGLEQDRAQAPTKDRHKPEPQPRRISTRTTRVEVPTEPMGPSALKELARLGGDTLNPEAQTIADRLREGVEQAEFAMAESNVIAPGFTMIDRFGGDIGSFAEYGFIAHDELDPSKYKDTFENPKNYQEAWNHPDPFQRKKWREAINTEFNKMNSRGVWEKIKRSEMEPGRRCVKHKWVLEIKRSGRFRARLVACGYSQIPGVDFTEVYSPVINDVSFRIAMVIKLQLGLDAVIFDVETAFLHGDLKEKIYMDCPDGMVTYGDECLLLKQTIYGLVQSAARYNHKFSAVLIKLGFERCPSDPCLFRKGSGEKILIILCYVDDNLVIGQRPVIDDFLNDFKKSEFKYTLEEGLSDYLSCDIQMDTEAMIGWIGQPHMVKKIEKTFGEEVSKIQKYSTPGTPGFKLTKASNESEMISDELQSRFRTGVGQLMFLIKHSRPDIMSAVRELTKVLGNATEAAYKEMLRCVKFVLGTKSKGLKLAPRLDPNDLWTLEVYSDSDWAGDPDDRKSVGCYIIFLNGVPIAWRSKSQKVVSLSSSEAEFYACAEAVREVPFVAQILLFLGIPVKTPVNVWIDNVGAIFMTENRTSSSRTRHMDTRWWYVTQMQEEDKLIKVQFVRTKENVSDLGTKNVNAETYQYHEGRLISDRLKK